jgi:uncharacterized membrane protein
MSSIFWITIAGALLTFLSRIGGHLVLSRFERVHPRVEVALNAVPAAVLTTLVAPVAAEADWKGLVALVFSGLVALRFSALTMFLAGAAMIILLRQFS